MTGIRTDVGTKRAHLGDSERMVRAIAQLGNSILKVQARAIDPGALSGSEILNLAADMQDTLREAGGVGLAAPQVGASVRLILAGSFPTPRSPDRPTAPMMLMANPRIVWSSKETAADWEGCLSFLRYRVRVVRPVSIRVEFLRMDGTPSELEATGFYARVLQHEIDHLDGVLTLDRATAPDDIEELSPPGS
jgi:peptide deformylase